jgi:hypothetical protein
MGYFIPIFIEKGDIQDDLQLLVAIIPDIGIGTIRLQEIISLLPYPDGMSLDTREIFQVFYGKDIHHRYLQGKLSFV